MEVLPEDAAVVDGGVVQAAGGGGEDGGCGGVEVDDGLVVAFDGVAVLAAAGLVFEGALVVDGAGVGLVEAVGVVGPGLGVVGGDAVGGGALGQAGGKFAGLFELADGFCAIQLGAGDVLAAAGTGAGGDEEALGGAEDAPAVGFEFKAGAAPVAAFAAVGGLVDDVAGVVLAVPGPGCQVQAALAGGVVKCETGVVGAIDAAAVQAADGAGVVGGAVLSGAVGGDGLGVVDAADDERAVGVAVQSFDEDFVANAGDEVAAPVGAGEPFGDAYPGAAGVVAGGAFAAIDGGVGIAAEAHERGETAEAGCARISARPTAPRA